MRIGVYAAHIAVRPGYEEIVSGHIQIPLRTAELLREAGHEVHVITTRRIAGRVWPFCLPPGCAVHEIDDPSRQGAHVIAESGKRGGLRPLGLLRWLVGLRALARVQRLDAVHFFGATRTGLLAGLYRLTGAPPVLVTVLAMHGFPERPAVLTRPIWRRLDRILTTTDYFAQALGAQGIGAEVLRHGVVRDLVGAVRSLGPRPRRRVLFWREATPRNGGDVALEVFRLLAPRHPDIQFDFALRPHWEQVPGLEELAAAQANVAVYSVPYPPGVTLAGLLAESICVLQPFRAYTFQPQLSLLESLAAGVPVVAADIESTRELIRPGQNGTIVPPGDVASTAAAVEALLLDPARARAMGEAASCQVAEQWTWNGYVERLQREYAAVAARP